MTFGFCLLWFEVDGAASGMIHDATEGRRHVAPADRAAVVQLLCHHAASIVRQRRPASFTMESFHANLPARARAKYDSLCAAFQAVGYTVRETLTADGKHLWTMHQSAIDS